MSMASQLRLLQSLGRCDYHGIAQCHGHSRSWHRLSLFLRFSTRRALNQASVDNPRRKASLEDLSGYVRGGYHPVHIKDYLKEGQYQILHKLGHGSSSTVWLGWDNTNSRYVSLKIKTAIESHPESDKNREVIITEHLREVAENAKTKVPSITFVDNFQLNGPNGTHNVLVSTVIGPTLSSIVQTSTTSPGSRRLQSPIAAFWARKFVEAVSRLHGAGVTHGNIHPKNLIFDLARSIPRSAAETDRLFGEPSVQSVSPPNSPGLTTVSPYPKYLVEPISFSWADVHAYTPDSPHLIDLDTAVFDKDNNPSHSSIQLRYSAPELALGAHTSQASDMWALACLIFEIRCGFRLFDGAFQDYTDLLEDIVKVIGPPGKALAEQYISRGIPLVPDNHFFDGQDGLTWRVLRAGVSLRASDLLPSEASIRLPRTFSNSISSFTTPPNQVLVQKNQSESAKLLEDTRLFMPGAEYRQFLHLLRSMLVYDPEKRPTASALSKHGWFTVRPLTFWPL